MRNQLEWRPRQCAGTELARIFKNYWKAEYRIVCTCRRRLARLIMSRKPIGQCRRQPNSSSLLLKLRTNLSVYDVSSQG